MIIFNAKLKIFIVGILWVLICISMPTYFFGIFEHSNNLEIEKINSQKKELLQLKAEQDSYQKAKKDLEIFAKEKYQPENFFNNEINVVSELKTLEALGPELGLDVSMSGLSGTIGGAAKAAVQGDIVQLPYSFTVVGPYNKTLQFLEILENLDFVVHNSSFAIGPSAGGNINLVLSSFLYLKRK
jgi:Tfp pilus assembly protein PilO